MEKFLKRVEEEYGQQYDLTRTVYSGTTVPLEIICPDHGVFTITPDNFIYNRGCPACRGVHVRGYPKRKNTGGKGVGRIKQRPGRKPAGHSFYIHEVSGGFLKIGITSGSVESRRITIENKSDYIHAVIFTKIFHDRRILAAVEKAIKRSFKTRVAPDGSMRDGITETIHLRHLDAIIKIVESFPTLRV